ncbi:olfactory receptor 5V1-like [Rhinophrynus dorsalis]
MLMDNQTSVKEFYLLAFSRNPEKQPFLFLVFFFIYLIGVLWNLAIIIVIYRDSNLHTPMYLFLSNLSLVDICYTTTILPKLMDILLSAKTSISFIQCFTQMYFFVFMAGSEVSLLSFMAYDRYVAICIPLNYHLIMNRKTCGQFLACIWISAFVNSLFFTVFSTNLPFCQSIEIQQFFCDIKAVAKISCDTTKFYSAIYFESTFFGLFTFLLSLISYCKIIASILHIKSKAGKQKAFSTCTSHLTVLIIFYGSVMWMYMRPPSEHMEIVDQVSSLLYVAIVPMLNPLIYSLRNKDVKTAMKRIVQENYKKFQLYL